MNAAGTQMNGDSKRKPTPAPRSPHTRGGARLEEASVWVVTSDPELCERLSLTLEPWADRLAVCDLDALTSPALRASRAGDLRLIVLDVDRHLDQSSRAIQSLRNARINAPVVVITDAYSREFGAKIISQGVKSHFLHDYCEEELLEVASSLLQ